MTAVVLFSGSSVVVPEVSYLLTVSGDAKTVKGESEGFLTAVQYLSPSRESGVNTCAFASSCFRECISSTGRLSFAPSERARIARTDILFRFPSLYWSRLVDELRRVVRRASSLSLRPVVRLNGTSDLPFERIPFSVDGVSYRSILDVPEFSSIIFYDYTKNPGRRSTERYPLTFSRSELNCPSSSSFSPDRYGNWESVVRDGGTVAVVFDRPPFPKTFRGFPVVNGDSNDLRFLDPPGSVVALKAKGPARRDVSSGFVVSSETGRPLQGAS